MVHFSSPMRSITVITVIILNRILLLNKINPNWQKPHLTLSKDEPACSLLRLRFGSHSVLFWMIVAFPGETVQVEVLPFTLFLLHRRQREFLFILIFFVSLVQKTG